MLCSPKKPSMVKWKWKCNNKHDVVILTLSCAASLMKNSKPFSYPTGAALRSTGSGWVIIISYCNGILKPVWKLLHQPYLLPRTSNYLYNKVNTWKLSRLIVFPNETSFMSCDQTGGIATEEDRRRNILLRISSFKLHSAEVWLYCFGDRRSQLE